MALYLNPSQPGSGQTTHISMAFGPLAAPALLLNETGRSITIAATATAIDQVDFKEVTALSVPVVATVTLPTQTFTHLGNFNETGRSISVVATATAGEQVDYKSNVGLAIPVVATAAATFQIDYKSNVGLEVSGIATYAAVDQVDFKELALAVPAVADVRVNDSFGHLGNFSDLNLLVSSGATLSTPTSKVRFRESGAPGTLVNRPPQSWAVVYDDDMTNVSSYARPGGLIVAGRTNYANAAFQNVSANGGCVLLYLDPIVWNNFGTYHTLLYNSSAAGAVVPKWPGPITTGPTGDLADFRVGGVLQGKLEAVLETMVTDNPHMGGFFMDDVGSRSYFPNDFWTGFGSTNQADYRAGAIAVCQTVRRVCDKYGLVFIVNGTWNGGTLAALGGGYPTMGTHGLSLADGGLAEHHSLDAFWTDYGNSSQWASASLYTRGTSFMLSNTVDNTDRDAFIASNAYAYVVTQISNDYDLAPVPYSTLHYTGLPSRVGGVGPAVPVAASITRTDIRGIKELALAITAVATITRTDTYVPGTAPLVQEGFRWRNDDGSETTATWKAAQDTNASLALATSARLRMLLDTTADLSVTPTLYYKKSTDSTWLPVPVGSGGGGPVYVATSSNITAGGEATTALLTAPSGKTTADFSVGRMWDDENGSDVLTIGGGGTTAVTVTMEALKPSAMLKENLTLRAKVVVTADGNVPGQGTPPGYGNTNQPVGTVTFYDGGTPMLTTPINIYGEADVVRTNLTLGTHNITATYNGTATYATGSAGPVVQTITAAKVAPTLSTWQANYDSYNLANITSWYQYNTGHLAQGFDPANLWGPGTEGPETVDAAWLTANEGSAVVNDGGGHWTITGLHASGIEVRVSNLTFNHCCVERLDFATVWGGGFGFYQVGVGADEVTISNIVFNYCTGFTDGTGVESGGWGSNIGTYGDAMGYNPATPAADQVVFNYCEFSQWRAGFLTWGGVTANYCWVHALDLFGLDPHNTSASIRDQHTKFYRNLFCDGTSSDISLYADSTPYTNFYLTENILWLAGSHAIFEINFPVRGTGWHPLSAGYVRECVGNLLLTGSAGDMAYFSKVAGNRKLGTGKKLFACADPVQTTNDPSVLQLMNAVEYFGHAEYYDTYSYTPSPNSTLFLFQATGQFGHATTPSLSITDTSGGSWTAMTGASTPVEGWWGNGNYGLSAEIRTQQPGATPAFRHLTIDPYATSAEAIAATMIVEVTGRTGMTLAKPVVLSAKGNATSFGAHLGTFTSGTLSSAATSGHLVMWFIAYRHEGEGGIPAPPAGWFMNGNNWDPETGAAVLWRKDFTGTSVTISDMGILDVAVSILCEFN